MAQLISVKLSRFDATPWGFRLQGGKDFGSPLVIQKNLNLDLSVTGKLGKTILTPSSSSSPVRIVQLATLIYSIGQLLSNYTPETLNGKETESPIAVSGQLLSDCGPETIDGKETVALFAVNGQLISDYV
uniref:Uncharacterized protein n=1 Tax=Timema genevievae TaxID=629358 RepID=A0A7R9K1R5_TIMGE|nr:unnamed protein product [Timema genevievae]